MVTCNYEARKLGVNKCMSLKDAKEKCPQLVFVNGEDLTKYREMSYKVTGILFLIFFSSVELISFMLISMECLSFHILDIKFCGQVPVPTYPSTEFKNLGLNCCIALYVGLPSETTPHAKHSSTQVTGCQEIRFTDSRATGVS